MNLADFNKIERYFHSTWRFFVIFLFVGVKRREKMGQKFRLFVFLMMIVEMKKRNRAVDFVLCALLKTW